MLLAPISSVGWADASLRPAESTPAGSDPTHCQRLFVRAERWKGEVGVKSSGRMELEGTRIHKPRRPLTPAFCVSLHSFSLPRCFFSSVERRHAT